MNEMFSQGGKGSTGILTNKQAIARKFGVKQNEVVYFAVGVDLGGYKVIYDKETQRAYSLPADIAPGTTAVSLSSSAVLVHSAGSVDLGELAVSREEYVTLPGSFNTGATLNVKNELLTHVTSKYRWNGEFPKIVPAGTDPTLPGSGYIMHSGLYTGAQTREGLRRSYAEAGYNLVDGSFEAGGTLVNANDVLLQERTGKAFSGPAGTVAAGTVAAGTNPASGGFVDRSVNIWLGSSAVSSYGFDGEAVQSAIDATNMDTAAVKRGAIEFKAGSLTEISSQIEIFRKKHSILWE